MCLPRSFASKPTCGGFFGCLAALSLLLCLVSSSQSACPTGWVTLLDGRTCDNPCNGIVCPDKSKCASYGGAPTCVCPQPYKRLINNVCSTATLAHSEYLDLHNAARAAVGAVPLSWNAALVTRAAFWAGQLVSKYRCSLVHGDLQGVGQNLAAGTTGFFNASDAVGWWLEEAKDYFYDKGCRANAVCGHYTQMVWNKSIAVGCAKSSCGGTDVWVCDYSPPGNWNNELPYVRSPCYRVTCPGGSSCANSNGQAVCVCPRGLALINRVCVADPCLKSTAPKCTGDLVCSSSTGTATCVCPTNTVKTGTNTCAPPGCVNVACPAKAACRVDVKGVPFCACGGGLVMAGDNTCLSPTVGAKVNAVSVAFYGAANYAGSRAVVRAPTPGTCFNLPTTIAGHVGSAIVQWNIQADTVAPAVSVRCKIIWFWTDSNCYGYAIGYYPPSDLSNLMFSPPPDQMAKAKSIKCD